MLNVEWPGIQHSTLIIQHSTLHLLANRLQLGDHFQIFRASRGHFALDQRIEVDDPTSHSEQLDGDRPFAQHFVIESAGDLAEDIEGPCICGQSEVQSCAHCFYVEVER